MVGDALGAEAPPSKFLARRLVEAVVQVLYTFMGNEKLKIKRGIVTFIQESLILVILEYILP